ncbi:DUF6912 family protein [uncultured Pseudokineococcus sp.]|uniref:DUF6912 family protein n=1 Tax=uncultured Pseudokineococcus sp. TaxID=1642928 RepID=UPI002625777F|nr:hypothetical protein [uncultured Pseudokineococcus sp.]
MRVYVPATLPLLAAWLDAGSATAPRARAVTPAVREWYSGGDEEELEFSALLDAATDSLALLAEDGTAPRRRLVLAADVPDGDVRALGGPLDDEPPTAVELARPLPLSAVVSAHCDEPDAQEAVRAAAQALPAARAGDEDAAFVVDGAEDGDLLWYDARELGALLGDG